MVLGAAHADNTFNGAATARSRNCRRNSTPSVQVLQWGRDRAIAEQPSHYPILFSKICTTRRERPRAPPAVRCRPRSYVAASY